MTSSLRQHMLHDLQLAGLSERTQEAYLRAVRQLADHFQTPPDRLTEPQLRDFFLHLKMTLDAMEFLRRSLQHVLPSGLPKVRHYGFLSPACAVGLELVRWLIAPWAGLTYVLRARRAEEPSAPAPSPGCPACGGPMVRLGFVPAPSPAVFDTS